MPFTAKQAEAFGVLSDPKTRQVALLGGSRSGKSYTIGHKFRQRAIEFPGVLQFILRKTMADARDTVWLQTMLPILRGDQVRGHCRIYKQPALAEYTNGSIIRIGGLHPSEIDKILGSEAGTAWINEASEAAWSNIPAIRTRLNDRTPHAEHGRPIVPKLICDFNPPTVKHWTHKAFVLKIDPESGNPLPDAESWAWLQMNPYDNTANLSASYLSTLESMSERDKQRFLYGNFGQLKGLVYDCFDPELNVYDDGATGDRYFRAIDFGFTNPFVCLWGRLASDDTLYITHELYQAGVTVDRHAAVINELTKNKVEATYADHDAGEREVLRRAGIPTEAAKKDVKAGINLLYGMIEKRKIKIHRSCQNLISELQSYQWKEGAKGDEVIKLNDHACFTASTRINAKRVQLITSTGIKDVYQFRGARVTACHPYLTPRGFVRLDALSYIDKIVIWKKLFMTEYHLDGTRNRNAVSFASISYLLRRAVQAARQSVSIGIYGKSTMVSYLKACMSITSMATRLIMTYLISNVLLRSSIMRGITMSMLTYGVKTSRRLRRRLKLGIGRKRAEYSIKSLVNSRGRIKLSPNQYVNSAAGGTVHITQHAQNSAAVIAKLRHCGREEVFAVTCQEGSYTVKGAVVSNCDSARYMVMGIFNQSSVSIGKLSFM